MTKEISRFEFVKSKKQDIENLSLALNAMTDFVMKEVEPATQMKIKDLLEGYELKFHMLSTMLSAAKEMPLEEFNKIFEKSTENFH